MEPSNTDIFREVQDIQRGQSDLHTMVKDHELRLKMVENFVIAYEAATKALASVSSSPAQNTNKDFKDFVLKIIGLMTVIVALLTLIVQQVTK